jgi:broad specificity phosphatase PhoE
VSLFVVRHADAGDRGAWPADDRGRPLTSRGHAQAEALARRHATPGIGQVLSSPYRRCVQTVQPLAARLELPVEEDDALAEGAAFDRIDGLLSRLSGPDDAVLCSHGDVIGSILGALRHRGVDLGPELTWRKASTWVIDAWPDASTARLIPRPETG